MKFLPIDVLRIIYEYDSTYRDVMKDVVGDINNGIGAEVLGIDGSDNGQFMRTELFGIDWNQWNSICVRYYWNNLSSYIV